VRGNCSAWMSPFPPGTSGTWTASRMSLIQLQQVEPGRGVDGTLGKLACVAVEVYGRVFGGQEARDRILEQVWFRGLVTTIAPAVRKPRGGPCLREEWRLYSRPAQLRLR